MYLGNVVRNVNRNYRCKKAKKTSEVHANFNARDEVNFASAKVRY